MADGNVRTPKAQASNQSIITTMDLPGALLANTSSPVERIAAFWITAIRTHAGFNQGLRSAVICRSAFRGLRCADWSLIVWFLQRAATKHNLNQI